MLKPQATIRRFDVFAEYNRQQAIKRGMRAAQAKGHALWLAKVVAARRFHPAPKRKAKKSQPEEAKISHGKWRLLSGKPQTDKLFDKEIVNRMGREFYRETFSKAIRRAIQKDESYQDMRDSIRTHWEPA